ncbi:MAG: magnesium transporter, partial [Oscillospiraceae bacterium]
FLSIYRISIKIKGESMNENEILLVDSVRAALQSTDKTALAEIWEDVFPIDIAIAFNDLDDDELLSFLMFAKDQSIAAVLEQANEDLQQRMLLLLENEHVLKIFSFMSRDDVADVLGNLPIDRRKGLVNLMKVGDQKLMQQLLGYDEDTAGGIMTTEYIALNENLSAENALKKIKQIAPKTEVIEVIFIINASRELVGTADLRDILVAKDDTVMAEIMNDNVITVYPETDQENVSLLVSKYDLKAIAVINRKNSLLGIVTVDDIIDVIVEEHTEDMLRMGGVNEGENINSSLGESIKMRLPWLFVNLLTAFLASFTVSLFEGTIAQVVALAAAMPIVAGMGGNAGTQTLSIVIRSIALGEIDLKHNWKLLLKEVCLGLFNGAATGAVTGAILFLRYQNPWLGLIIFAAMIGNLVIAGFFGFVIPLVLKALKQDPALASAVFLTTATDVFGFFIFLGLAQLALPLLV